MSMYWSEIVKRLDPYVPGEQPSQKDLIKLNTNENPYPPSPKVLEALSHETLDLLRLYPDPNSDALRHALASNSEVNPEQVFVGNGSDEVLALAFMAFFKNDKPLLYPDITYGFYPAYCHLCDIEYKAIPLSDDFTVNLSDYEQTNGGIIFPNPNAPTGMVISLESVEALLKVNTSSVVIVDEAYIDFGGESATSLVDRYENLLVIQTLSKSRSLAGLRVGSAIGHKQLIEALNRVKNSFNSYPLDRIAQTAAVAAVQDVEYFQECNRKIIATRQWTTNELQRLGFTVLPSYANFVFAHPPTIENSSINGTQLYTLLREKGILVRHFNKSRIDQFVRITIGTDEQMRMLINIIEQIFK